MKHHIAVVDVGRGSARRWGPTCRAREAAVAFAARRGLRGESTESTVCDVVAWRRCRGPVDDDECPRVTWPPRLCARG